MDVIRLISPISPLRVYVVLDHQWQLLIVTLVDVIVDTERG